MSTKHLLIAGSVMALFLLIVGCAAPQSGEPDPRPPGEHSFHTAQEHNDRAGAIPPRGSRQD